MITVTELNQMSETEFVTKIGWVFENTPWVSEKAWEYIPFSSIESLHKIMTEIVKQAPKQQQLDLIRAHPDLGTRIKINPISQTEQNQVGLHQLTVTEFDRFVKINQRYLKKFGFPFILAVRGHNKTSIYSSMINRVNNPYQIEFETALTEINKITLFRLRDLLMNEGGGTGMESPASDRVMFYGKGDVFTYRTYASPLKDVKSIPESTVRGRENVIFGVNITVAIGGKQFLSSFSEGDNGLVVATDSMKNFIQRQLASYCGSTIDGFLNEVAQQFLQTYPQMETVKITGEEIPFLSTNCITKHQLQKSELVFKKSRNEKSFSTVEIIRSGDTIKRISHISGVRELQLIKISGNSFVGFVRDEYTSLPEDDNRPLFVHLNISWKYQQDHDIFGENPEKYVLAEQVTDIATAVFHDLDTKSIQQLIYQIGIRILDRFPQLSEVLFESQNRTWETVVDEIPHSKGKVYTEPRPPYGFQGFTVTKQDLEKEKLSSVQKESKR
ncbi:factor-independent urate hydroxylase [Bacillus sp. 1NLA3E]|uniref:factor-independent urate hydroxylase n=1 Tax=Bacillus sp. 1NLA3E TaxID=666686 RepID=UPI000247E7F1|nr:urate oxidase [Bacillus sp. 1NLA3E]AGK54271.1 urate oxidase [Bacillus sp. 1NLA3E]